MLRAFLVSLVMLISGGLLSAGAAHAHAGLVASDPVDGAVLAEAPAKVVLTFTEPVTPLVVTLVNSDGERRDLAPAASQNDSLSVDLPPGLARGTHLLSWRIVSADGHPVAGTLAFSIGEPGIRPRLDPSTDPVRSGLIWVVRAGLHVLLLVVVGGAVFGFVVQPLPPALARSIALLAVAGLPLTLVSLGLQGLDAMNLGLGHLFLAPPWQAAFGTSYAATCGLMLLAFSATLLGCIVGGGRRSGLVLLAWGCASLAPMLSGHAGTAEPLWISKPAVALHIASLIFWVGALWPLAYLLRTPSEPDSARALRRFSAIIPVPVLLLVGSGVGLAALQLGPPGQSWISPYGGLLLVKLLLVAGLLALALWNRLRLTKPALAFSPGSAGALRRSIVIELVLVALIIGVVAGWRFTPPPRVLAEIAAQPVHAHIHTADAMADIALTPGHAGPVTLSVYLMDGAMAPLVPRAVTVVLSNPVLGVERLTRPASLDADGYWRVPVVLPAGGTWTLGLELRVDDFTQLRLTGDLELGS